MSPTTMLSPKIKQVRRGKIYLFFLYAVSLFSLINSSLYVTNSQTVDMMVKGDAISHLLMTPPPPFFICKKIFEIIPFEINMAAGESLCYCSYYREVMRVESFHWVECGSCNTCIPSRCNASWSRVKPVTYVEEHKSKISISIECCGYYICLKCKRFLLGKKNMTIFLFWWSCHEYVLTSISIFLCGFNPKTARSKSMVLGDLSGVSRPCSPLDREKVLKAGWLKRRRIIMKNWQLRWFVLNADILYFYKDQNETKEQVICKCLSPGKSLFSFLSLYIHKICWFLLLFLRGLACKECQL